jgi:multidrug resistance efflux pump
MDKIKEKIHVEEVEEILTSTPNGIFRWGNVLFLLIFLVVILFSYFIKYPDILVADIILTNQSPSVKLVAKTTGVITNLLVKDKQIIESGQIICILENTANYQDIQSAEKISNLINTIDLSQQLNFNTYFENKLSIGELTNSYLLIQKSINDYFVQLTLNPYKKQIELLKNDLTSHNTLIENYINQKNIRKEQFDLSEKDFKRDKNLVDNNVISTKDFESKKKEFLSSLNNYEEAKIAVSNSSIQLNSIKKHILALQIQESQEVAKYKSAIYIAVQQFQAELLKWKQTFLIISPIKGKISFFSIWSDNQKVTASDELFSITPLDSSKFIGKCLLPIENTGKLEIMQMVNVKLDNFPYPEYGILNGKVTSISEIPLKDLYSIDVELVNGLKTSYSRTLPSLREMKGKAEIITKNISVLERVFYNLRKLIH